MGRKFNLPRCERKLQVCVVAIDEAWELWLCENDKPLVLGATVSIDAALLAWREGNDAILRVVDRIHSDIASGKVRLPAGPNGAVATDRSC